MVSVMLKQLVWILLVTASPCSTCGSLLLTRARIWPLTSAKVRSSFPAWLLISFWTPFTSSITASTPDLAFWLVSKELSK